MPYPAKTNAQTILTASIDYLEKYGEDALSMRELANTLGLSPRALYRYYPDRAALDAAMAEEGFRRLHIALVSSIGTHVGRDALQASAIAYLDFARSHPAWYSLLMRFNVQTPGLLQAGHEMWASVVGLVEHAVGQERAASAAVALWAFLHGFIQLESAAILGEEKPLSGFQVGLDAFLSGLTLLSTHEDKDS
jgi:AcrR family transcriptional regulator